MHTRCPECQTTFKVTAAQLAAREGIVRCGKCAAVFNASEHLLPATARKRTARRSRPAAPARPAPPPAPAAARAPQRRWRATALWSAGSAALLLLLAFQAVYFFSAELARDPALRPALRDFCDVAGCDLGAAHDVRLIELSETTIAPHPNYLNALRIRATLVNRASYPQPFPRMEVSLTDSQGKAVARRHFAAREYLERTDVGDMMLPHVVVNARLDVTTPDSSVVGYEVQLVAP